MVPFNSPQEYLFNLYTTSSGDAKRIWKKHIKDSWNNECAYCQSTENLTLDHIIPQSKGGLDVKTNVVSCCHSCNQSKGHIFWEDWYESQDFFCESKSQKIKDWIRTDNLTSYVKYGNRKNILK